MKKLLFLSFATLFLFSCSKDDNPEINPIVSGDYAKGIFITNEGPFSNGSGSITFISEDFNTVEQKIYRKVNGSDLGNIVQSMGLHDQNAFIVVNNSNKVMIANRNTFVRVDSITSGLESPRYFVGAGSSKGYITNWGDPNNNADDYVAVVDLTNNSVSAKIPVSFGPERMLVHNNKVYVAHQGGYGQNNLISIISGNTVEKTITVGDVPNSMVVKGNDLFVLCAGSPLYSGTETAGSLIKIDLGSGAVTKTYPFATTQHPTSLTADGDTLLYTLDGKIYKLDASAVTLPGTEIIEGFFYALEAKNGKLFATDAGDYSSQGVLKVFDLSTNQEIHEFQTGIIPGGIYFNE